MSVPVIGPTPAPELDPVRNWSFRAATPSEERAAIARAKALNATSVAAQDRQLTLAAENAPIRFGYGRDRIGAQIVNILPYGNYVVVQCLWGFPVDSIESVTLNDAALPAGTLQADYDGSQVAADSTLVAAFAAQTPSITYGDTLNGYSYTVLRIPSSAFTGGLSISAIVNWRKVWDYRTSDYDGTDNPSLALADFLTDTTYGCGLTVDSTSVSACANWNDTDLSGERQRLIGWTVNGISPVATIVETLRAYASVFLVRRGATLYMVPDKADSSVATYSHAAGQIARYSAVEKRDLGDSPTIVEVIYTDTSKLPWRDRSAFSPAVAGETTRRLSTIRLNGVQRYSQAYREAVERLNKLVLNDLSFSITVFDIGIKHEPGDVVTVTLPFGGIASKEMRVVDVTHDGPGMWSLSLNEYDPGVYSTEVNTTPTYSDTAMDSPAEPVPPDGVAAAEELFQQADGSWNARLRITITPPSFAWIAGYRVEIFDGSMAIVDSGTTLTAEYATPALEEGVNYTIRAYTISTLNVLSTYAQTAKTFEGKLAAPSDVASISGFEIGGQVFLNWPAAVDLDLEFYEVRYSATDAGWSSAIVLDQVHGLRTTIKGVLAEGSWWFYVKARDASGNYSANAAKVQIAVTLDPNALQTEAFPDYSTSSGMVSYTERDGEVYDQTAVGAATFGSQFTSSLGTYTSVIGSYWAGTFSWESDDASDPWGVDLSGDWNCDASYVDISGTATKTLSLATTAAYPTFSDYTTLPVKATARYAKVTLDGSGAIKLKRGMVRTFVNAQTREEVGNDTSSAGGGTTVTLTNKYFTWRDFHITPYATGTMSLDQYSPYVDNIVMHPTNTNSFDVHVIDGGGSRVAVGFNWKFKGI